MLRLYYAPGACSLASHLALERAGADYEAVPVNFGANAQRSAEYLALNPRGRVPTLVTEHGPLYETPAILLYVAMRFPDAGLAPLDDLYAVGRFNAYANWLCSTVHPAHAHGRRGYRWADDPAAIAELKRKMPEVMGECFALAEREWVGPWVLGDRFSAVDLYLFTIARWLEGDGVDLGPLPRIADHRARVGALPFVQKVLADEAAGPDRSIGGPPTRIG